MSPDQINSEEPTALDLRHRLIQLEAERHLAQSTGLSEVRSFMADLDEELEATRQLYILSAVTEIATLRAELFGAQVG